jgi:hypothetical protein
MHDSEIPTDDVATPALQEFAERLGDLSEADILLLSKRIKAHLKSSSRLEIVHALRWAVHDILSTTTETVS